MSGIILANLFNRLTIRTCQINIRKIASSTVLNFKATPCLMAEPLKKKKKLDPAVLKAREDRKKKKIEKQIRRLEKSARQLKPIEECEVSLGLLDEKKLRMRSLPSFSAETLENQALLEKQWTTYKKNQHVADLQMLDSLFFSQQKALDELRIESEELYQETVQVDFKLMHFKSKGPLETPSIENYEVPDGDYLDVSRKWE